MPRKPIPEAIKPGLHGTATTVVCEHNVAGHVQMFGTPAMIGLMERASINAIDRLLDDDWTSVGYEVSARHLAATPIGKQVAATAELLEVQGNKLLFRVEASDEDKKIGEGTHRRAIVPRRFGK